MKMNVSMTRARRAALRATPLLRVNVKFTVKNAECMSLQFAAYGEFDCDLTLTLKSGVALRGAHRKMIPAKRTRSQRCVPEGWPHRGARRRRSTMSSVHALGYPAWGAPVTGISKTNVDRTSSSTYIYSTGQSSESESAYRKCVWTVSGHEILSNRTGSFSFWCQKPETPVRFVSDTIQIRLRSTL